MPCVFLRFSFQFAMPGKEGLGLVNGTHRPSSMTYVHGLKTLILIPTQQLSILSALNPVISRHPCLSNRDGGAHDLT